MGADRVVDALLSRLPTAHDYTIYVVKNGRRRPALPPHVRIIEIQAVTGKYATAASYFTLSFLHAALLGRFDVVHLHNSDVGMFSWLLLLGGKPGVVGTFHGDPYRRGKWGAFAKAFLRASEWSFVRMSDTLTSVTPTKAVCGRQVRYVPNGAEPWVGSARVQSTARYRVGMPSGPYMMFACGRLDPTKGLHHLLSAYSALSDAPPLLIVGDFSHDNAYSERVRHLIRTDQRLLVRDELLPREELLELVASADLFVFPSEHEGMAMMLLEAISTGVPVVCSDIPENLAVVGADYPWQFRSSDGLSLRRVLSTAMSADDARGIAAALREKVLSRFSWDVAAATYADLYRQVGRPS